MWEGKFLSAQFNQHMFFNALSCAQALMRKDITQAEELLTSLSECLIYTANTTEPVVPLARELKFIQHYLKIQSFRYGKRLRILYDINESSGLVPFCSLQTLVENVFSHVVLQTRAEVIIKVSTLNFPDGVQVSISDNGPGIPQSVLPDLMSLHRGKSLEQLNKFLLKHSSQRLVITSNSPSGTVVTMPSWSD